jgi:nicotinamidase/pyrazinamidase
VAGTRGAEFHEKLNTEMFSLVVRKGMNPEIDSYSTFRENDKKTVTGLDGFLKSIDIDELFICGLATDYCVFYSAIDAVEFGFKTNVIIDACRGIDVPDDSIKNALNTMKENRVRILTSDELKKEKAG